MELLLTSFFLGLGLSMDCLAVSFATGAHQKAARIQAAFILGLFFGGFQAGMTILGFLLGTGFTDYISAYDHWVASILLFAIGGKMIYDGFQDTSGEEGIDVYNLSAVFVLAVATSIDALAVGISFAFLKVSPFVPAGIIGLVAAVVSVTGVYTGGKAGHLIGERVDILGGAILVLIGLRILLQHTVWS